MTAHELQTENSTFKARKMAAPVPDNSELRELDFGNQLTYKGPLTQDQTEEDPLIRLDFAIQENKNLRIIQDQLMSDSEINILQKENNDLTTIQDQLEKLQTDVAEKAKTTEH